VHGGSAGHPSCRMPWRSPDTQHDVRTSAPAVPLSRSVRQSGWEASVDCAQWGSRSGRLIQTRGQGERCGAAAGRATGSNERACGCAVNTCERPDASKARGCSTPAAAGHAGGAGMTQDSHPSPPTGKERRERRLLCGARQPRCAGTWVLRGGKTRGRWHSGGS
jgi:hypothetical protein